MKKNDDIYVDNKKNEESVVSQVLNEKQLIAKVICLEGFGLKNYRKWAQQYRIQCQRKRYHSIASECVQQTFRKLQQFLLKECGKEISQLSDVQLKSIRAVLLKSKKHLKQNQYRTFIQFMKFNFSLGNVYIAQESAAKLYIQLQSMLKKRLRLNKLYNSKQKFGLQKPNKKQTIKKDGMDIIEKMKKSSLWTIGYDKQLIECFIKEQQFLKMKIYFKNKYKQKIPQIFTSYYSIKSRLLKLLRISLKRINKYLSQSQDIKSFIELDYKIVNAILKRSDTNHIKKQLALIHGMESISKETLLNVLAKIQIYFTKQIEASNKQVHEVDISPQISHSKDKATYNIQIIKSILANADIFKYSTKERKQVKKSLGNYQHSIIRQEGKNLHYFQQDASEVKKQFQIICKQEGLGNNFGEGKILHLKQLQFKKSIQNDKSQQKQSGQFIISESD